MLYELIKQLLEQYPILRDSDKLLVWNVWGKMGLLEEGSISKLEYMKAPALETITRARRKIQEDYPHLQSSEAIQKAKAQKAETKGDFIYYE